MRQKTLRVSFSKSKHLERFTSNLLRTVSSLDKITESMAKSLPEPPKVQSQADFINPLRGSIISQTSATRAINRNLKQTLSAPVPTPATPTKGSSKLKTLFSKLKLLMKSTPITAVAATAMAVFGIGIKVVSSIGSLAIKTFLGLSNTLVSFIRRGIAQASTAQTEFISQVNTLSTLQGKSFAVAAEETRKNNALFAKTVAGLPGNMATYTQIYQNGLDEQLAIFGSVENVLSDVKDRGADSFTVLLGKKASESGMPADFVIRDLSQLRNQNSIRGIGIVRSDIRLMQKFEENRARSVAELLDILKLDRTSAKEAAFSEGDKRILNLYASLYQTQNKDKDEANAKLLPAIMGRVSSALTDRSIGLLGFARVLHDSESLVDKSAKVLRELTQPLLNLISAITGSSLDPLEFLGTVLNEVRYQMILLNRDFMEFADRYLEFNPSRWNYSKPTVTDIAIRAGKFAADAFNFFINFVNDLFAKVSGDFVDPSTVLGTLTDAFYKTLDKQAIINATDSISDLILHLANLITQSGKYFWNRITAVVVNKEPLLTAPPVGVVSPVEKVHDLIEERPYENLSLGNIASAPMPFMPTDSGVLNGIESYGPRYIPKENRVPPISKNINSLAKSPTEAMQKSHLFDALPKLPGVAQKMVGAVKGRNSGLIKAVRTLQGAIPMLARNPIQLGDAMSAFGGDLPPAPDRATYMGQKLIIQLGKYIQRTMGNDVLTHQHPAFGEYRHRGTGSYHDVGRAVDFAPYGTQYPDGREQIPVIEQTLKWMKATGNSPVEFIHGSYAYSGTGLLDTPSHPTVGGIHGMGNSHLHVAMYKGLLSPLRAALAEEEAKPTPRPEYTIEINEISRDEMLSLFEREVDKRVQQYEMVKIA